MVIGIISAMKEELEQLINELKLEKKIKKANMEFNSGKLYGKDIVMVVCGIGKVNAAVCTQILIDEFNVDKIINVGVAGGIPAEIMPGDVVIAENLLQHDMDTSKFGDKIGQIPRLDTYDFKCDSELVNMARNASESMKTHKTFVGRIISGDQFICSVDKIKWLSKQFDASACEMEGASIAQVCYLNKKPFVVIRSISDNANNGAHIDYEVFKGMAVINSNNIIRYMLREL